MIADRPQAWPVTQRQVLATGAVSSFVDERVQTPDGQRIARQFITHPGAVAVVAWDTDVDAIACLRQYRHPVRMELVEIPAGLLDSEDEVWQEAAQRELAEEVELAAGRWDVLVDMCTTPGANEESLRIFLARDLRPTDRPEGFELAGEELHMTWSWVDRAELVSAVFAGRCQSPTLVAGVMALEAARLAGTLDGLRPADADWPIRHQRR